MCLFLDIVTMVLVTRQATRWATAFKTVSLTTKLPRANVRAAAVFRRVARKGLVPRGHCCPALLTSLLKASIRPPTVSGIKAWMGLRLAG